MHVRCPHCKTSLEIAEHDSPRRIECSACGSGFVPGELQQTITYVSNPSESTVLFAPPAEEPRTPQPPQPTAIGDYEILEPLGRGGMGVVYKALQKSLGRIVAVKMIRAGEMADEDDIRRFRSEAEAAAHLQHPHIVAIHEVGKEVGQHYFSMDYVEGRSLSDVVRENPLPARKAAAYLKSIAEAVHYAHQQGILHRDLKPSNVLIDLTDQPRVTDFGLAKRLEADSQMTATGQIVGTPSYMPPEQASGQRDHVGPASDVYSLGAMLYECLTGRPPFRAESPVETVLQVVHDEPVSPRLLNPNTSRDLETICLKCLEKEPDKRYVTAQELADDLQRFLAGQAIVARPIGRLNRGWRWCKRKPAVAALTAAVTLALVAGTIISSYFAVRASVEARHTITEKNRADEKAAEAHTAAKRADRKAAEALANAETAQMEKTRADQKADEARRQLYITHMNLTQSAWEEAQVGAALNLLERYGPGSDNADLRGFEWYYWDRLCHSYLLSLKAHTRVVVSVAFSRDGKRLASAGFDGTVTVCDAVTGQKVLALAGHTGPVRSVAFSPDGTRLTSTSQDGTVTVWDAATGQEVLTLKGHTGPISSVAFSPHGLRLASAGSDGTVTVSDAATGKQALTLKGYIASVTSVAFSSDGRRLALASTSYAGTVAVWDAATGQEVLTLKGHTGEVRRMAFSPDGKRLALASKQFGDRTVTVWDAATGQETLTLKESIGDLMAMAFSPDGRRLALASTRYGGTVKMWDAGTGQETLTLRGPTSAVLSVDFSPDGRRLASANGNGTVTVWDAVTGQQPLTLKGQRHIGLFTRVPFMPTSVAFSADGRRIASGSYDRTVKVWDAASGQETLTLKGHAGPVSSVAFSPDGERIASGSYDRTVKVWDARPLTPELRVEREALSVVRFLFEYKKLPYDEALQRIREDQTIIDAVRQKALEFAPQWRDETD